MHSTWMSFGFHLRPGVCTTIGGKSVVRGYTSRKDDDCKEGNVAYHDHNQCCRREDPSSVVGHRRHRVSDVGSQAATAIDMLYEAPLTCLLGYTRIPLLRHLSHWDEQKDRDTNVG